MVNIGHRGFGGKKLSNKRRKKRGNNMLPTAVGLIIFAAIIYFFFYSGEDTPQEETTEEPATPATKVAPADKPSENKIITPTPKAAVTVTQDQPKTPISGQEKTALIALYKRAKTALSQGDLILARELGEQILGKVSEHTTAWQQAADIISKANTLIFTTDYISPDKTNHIVRAGDSLDKIVKQYCTTLEAIQKSNNLPTTSSTIRLNQSLIVFKGEWSIRISKSKFRLQLYNKGKLFKAYKIATGKGNKTPEGKFVIAAKIKEPEWTNKGIKYPFGTPENVLGTRWMKLRAAKDNPNKHLTGYGIHGTWEPDSLGKMASNGCIRMKNSDVEELFAIIPKYNNPDGRLVPVLIER